MSVETAPAPAALAALATQLARWWWSEALRRLPARWRPEGPGTVRAEPDGDGFRLSLALPDGGLEPLGRLGPGAGAPPALPDGAGTVLALTVGRLLRRRFQLPAAAERRLREVVALELDRRTPLRADQAYFAAEVAERPDGGTVEVDLVLVPRSAVDPTLERLRALGLEPFALELAEPDGRPVTMPLTAASRPAAATPRRLLLAAAALVLLALAPLLVRGVQLAMARQEAAALAAEGAGVRDRVQAVDDLRAAALFGAEAKRAAPSALVLSEALSRLLPDGTWLSELRYENGTIEVMGLTKDGSSLVPMLEESPHFEAVQFRSALVRDASGLDRFHLTARVVPHESP
ncbi:MAG TPA: PilN domain-containing protein [Azospirillaceae bacterium]|nr:PilN domain-containing protein [Azospirillaceae bacterium]